MELYEDKSVFIDMITAVSKSHKIRETIIEKDYFV